MHSFELSKALYLLFYKNCGSVDWTGFENAYTISAGKLIEEFNAFSDRINQEMIAFFQKSNISEELKSVSSMRSEWLEFLQRFSKFESQFEDKYKSLAKNKALNLDFQGILIEFLAEYSAYEKMQAVYHSLLSLDGQIDLYEKMIRFYRSQKTILEPQNI